MAKQILIVSNSFYPEISPRAFRTVELAKELARRGEHVTVLLPNRELYHKNPLPLHDISNTQTNNIKIIYGNSNLQREGEGNVKKNSKLRKFLPVWIQKMILYLYPHELFIKYDKGIYDTLCNVTGPYDAVISISYPAAIHRAVAKAAKRNPVLKKCIKIAEFSDPPFKGDFVKDVFPGYYCYMKHWGRIFDYFVTPVEKALECYTPYIGKERVKVIPQGFDMNSLKRVEYHPNPVPTFAYAGRFYTNIRDPRFFFDFLKSLDSPFHFDLYLNHIEPYFNEMIKDAQHNVKGEIVLHDAMPREELLPTLSLADFLVNFENTTSNATPSKLIDYAMTGRPIFSFNEKNFNKQLFLNALKGDYSGQVTGINLEDYDIRNVTNKFMELIGD